MIKIDLHKVIFGKGPDEELQKDEGVMQFALPKHGRGYVTESGELLLCSNGSNTTIHSYGHFENLSDGTYYFVYQPETWSIPEELHCIDEELAKDQFAFAVKLSYFLAKHPNYEGSREHDKDVFSTIQYGDVSTPPTTKQYRELHTPLSDAGFRVEAHSTC